jgi:hypothetical protein
MTCFLFDTVPGRVRSCVVVDATNEYMNKRPQKVELCGNEAAQNFLFDALWRRATDVKLLISENGNKLAYTIDGVLIGRNDLLTAAGQPGPARAQIQLASAAHQLFVANGGVATIEALARANDPFPLKMTPQLYRNLGTGRFEDVSSRAGSLFSFSSASFA